MAFPPTNQQRVIDANEANLNFTTGWDEIVREDSRSQRQSDVSVLLSISMSVGK